jgi:hypothetical protein
MGSLLRAVDREVSKCPFRTAHTHANTLLNSDMLPLCALLEKIWSGSLRGCKPLQQSLTVRAPKFD